MQTVSREIHFFESRPFGLSEPLLVLLGSSWSLPGPSWGPDGSQNGPKRELKMGPKMAPKLGPFLGALGPILGPIMGSKMCGSGGGFFNVFFDEKLQFRVGHSAIFDI